MAVPKRVAVYADVDPNLVDGSSIWLQSVIDVLCRVEGVQITVLLRTSLRRTTVIDPARLAANVQLCDPSVYSQGNRHLEPRLAARALVALDREHEFDVVFVRSLPTAALLARSELAGRVWAYYVPSAGALTDELVRSGTRLVCQTEAIRTRVARRYPNATLFVWPPAIPERPAPSLRDSVGRRLVYAGKVAPEYSFREMIALLRLARAAFGDVELHVAGDKIHDPPEDPGFRPWAIARLENEPGLVWHRALRRAAVLELLDKCDTGLSLRDGPVLDSAELSTKLLEYGSAGLPVVLPRTRANELALGSDYPLFAADALEAAEALARVKAEPELAQAASTRTHALAAAHGFGRVAQLVARQLETTDLTVLRERARPRIVVAGHQLSFIRPLVDRWRDSGADVREDEWITHLRHDEIRSTELLRWADVVICEWCVGNAAWYAERKRPGQRLIVHFHRSELETSFPRDLRPEPVDHFVFVAEHVRREALRHYRWQPERTSVIPNPIECARFDRPKLAGARATLALVGWVPRLKRLDLALEVLAHLRAAEPGFRLLVKGHAPESYEWMERRATELAWFNQVRARAVRAPLLRGAVTFEEHGEDLPAFFQKVGFVLSVSDVEGHQVSLAEGMASGAVPAVLVRDGASDQYMDEWVHDSPVQMARAISSYVCSEQLHDESAKARIWARRWDIEAIDAAWSDLVADGVSEAAHAAAAR